MDPIKVALLEITNNIMTIRELIEKLKSFNPDSPIIVGDKDANQLVDYHLEVTEFDNGYTVIYPWDGIVVENKKPLRARIVLWQRIDEDHKLLLGVSECLRPLHPGGHRADR